MMPRRSGTPYGIIIAAQRLQNGLPDAEGTTYTSQQRSDWAEYLLSRRTLLDWKKQVGMIFLRCAVVEVKYQGHDVSSKAIFGNVSYLFCVGFGGLMAWRVNKAELWVV